MEIRVELGLAGERWYAELRTYLQLLCVFGDTPLDALRKLRRHPDLKREYHALVDETIQKETGERDDENR